MRRLILKEKKLPPWVQTFKIYMRVVAVVLLVMLLGVTYGALHETRKANTTLQWTNKNYHLMVKHQNNVIKALQAGVLRKEKCPTPTQS